MNKMGYLKWRTFLKKRQGDLAAAICLGCNIPRDECDHVAALIRKEDLKNNEETQALEDVACLVFLEDQFDAFEKEHNEDKVVDIVRKTWGKMSAKGRELALGMNHSDRALELVKKALAGAPSDPERGDVKVD